MTWLDSPIVKHIATLQAAAEAIWLSNCDTYPLLSVEVQASMDSTNTELLRRARMGVLSPNVLLAKTQTAGRGRIGNTWVNHAPHVVTDQPQCLMFSIGLLWPTQVSLSGLSLALGLACAQCLDDSIVLKWPNDGLYQGRKLFGILVEVLSIQSQRYLVCGIGINIDPFSNSMFADKSAYLKEILPSIGCAQAFYRVTTTLLKELNRFEQQKGFGYLIDAWNQKDAFFGKTLTTRDGITGINQGVDVTGSLRLQTREGLRTINSGEVFVS